MVQTTNTMKNGIVTQKYCIHDGVGSSQMRVSPNPSVNASRAAPVTIPTPSWIQYFCVTIPFFIVFVVCTMSQRLDTARDGREKRNLLVGCAIILVAFVASS